LIEKPQEKKKILARPNRRCKNHIKRDITEIGCDGVDWIQLSQDRVRWSAFVNAIMNLRVS